MPPFSSVPNSLPTFNKDNPDFKKVGDLKDEPSTAALLSENRTETGEGIKRIEGEILDLQEKIRLLEKDRRLLFQKEQFLQNRTSSSGHYETIDGNFVASLPYDHPVIKTIEMNELDEKLKIGMKNLLSALKEEEKNRKAVPWTSEDVIAQAPDYVRDLVTIGTSKESFNVSWETPQGESRFGAEAHYIMKLFPELFTDMEKIKQINFCNELERERGSGFSGVAVFYGDDLYLIMKNGKRTLLTNTDKYKTYPQITKYGPNFAGYGKTNSGRFVFFNYCFMKTSSSGGYEPTPYDEEFTAGYLEDLVNSSEILEGIDPDTHYDKDKGCIVIGQPLF